MTAPVTALCLIGSLPGYFVCTRFLARRIFVLDPGATTPAHRQRDDIDDVPTRQGILFGHRYASITGLAPMLGPAVAVLCLVRGSREAVMASMSVTFAGDED
jgi:carbon starvation protein